MAHHRTIKPWLAIFVCTSVVIHFLVLGLSGKWFWRAPEFDMIVEPPPIVIQLAEIQDPPPPEPVPEPEVVPEIPIAPEPEPEPVPEPEVVEPEPQPEPVEPEPEVVEEAPAEILQVDQPSYLRNPAPPYPHQARRQGWEGTVVLRVNVQSDGVPASVIIVQSSGHAVLDDAALRTLRRWKFSSAKLAGQPVSATVDIPISFKLKELLRH